MISVHKSGTTLSAVCPYCKAPVHQREGIATCIRCGTPHHVACWEENANRCSVFRCFEAVPITVAVRKTGTYLSRMILFHTALNILIHFFIHPVGKLIESIHPADAVALLVMESGIIASGLLLVMALARYAGRRVEEHPGTLLSLLILGSNVTFAAFMLYRLLSQGVAALCAVFAF